MLQHGAVSQEGHAIVTNTEYETSYILVRSNSLDVDSAPIHVVAGERHE